MILKKIIILTLCLFFGYYYTQAVITPKSIDHELARGENIYISSPSETLDIFLKINSNSKSIQYKKGIIESGKYLIFIYHGLGAEEKAIEYTHEVEHVAKGVNDYESVAVAHTQRATVFSALGLSDESYNELQTAIQYVNKFNNLNKKHYHMSVIYQGLAAGYYIPEKISQDTILSCLKKSLYEAEQMTDKSEDIKEIEQKYDMISYISMNLGIFYTMNYTPRRLDLAEEYLLKSLKIVNTRKFTRINVNKLPILAALGQFYSVQNKHDKALGYAREILEIEQKQKSPRDRLLAYIIATNSYEGLKNKDSTIKYMELYTNLSDSLSYVGKQTTNSTVKKMNTVKEKVHKSNMLRIVYIAVTALLIVMLCSWFLWKRNQTVLHKRYQSIIRSLNKERKNSPLQPDIRSEAADRVTTPLSMAENTSLSLLSKLSRFERSERFIKKDLTLTSLANALNTNTRYLSEIIKQHKGKSFNSYINGLRIRYITNKLYENPVYREYKISYLAEACGFSSREVFAVIFKKETGVSPSYFINQLKKEGNDPMDADKR